MYAIRSYYATVHIKFSENHAILSGDAMAFEAYKYLLESESANLPDVITSYSIHYTKLYDITGFKAVKL